MKKRWIGAILCLLLAPHAALAETCSKSYRAWLQGGPEFREYRCATNGQEFRLSFLRLSEGLAGNLVLGEATPEIDNFFGTYKLMKNEVFAALEPLFRKFGDKQVYRAEDVEFAMNVKAPVDDGQDQWRSINLPPVRSATAKYRRIWSISGPFGNAVTAYPVFPAAEIAAMKSGGRWPSTTRMFYTCVDLKEDIASACMTLWRFLELRDLPALARNTEKVILKARRDMGDTEEAPPATNDGEESSSWGESGYQFRRHFAFFNHIGKTGWLPDFLMLTSGSDSSGCAPKLEFDYHARPMMVDAAVIENTSRQPLRIADLVGAVSAQRGLRPAAQQDGRTPKSEPLKPIDVTVEPGAKLIVPLRIVFLTVMEEFLGADTLEKSQAFYKKIRGAKKGTKFDVTGQKITRESFLPPQLPSQADALYGPEIKLAGLDVVAGETALGAKAWNRVELSTADNNYEKVAESKKEADLAAGDPEPFSDDTEPLAQGREVEASCPYLYAYDSAEKAWVNHGKTIHSADAPEKEMTSLVRVDPAARRFRLAEEEPEDSYIRSVKLILTLRDGRTVTLEPSLAQSRPATGFRFTIPAYTYREFSFNVAPEDERAGVLESTLAVTGYYLRLNGLQTVRVGAR